MTLGENIVRLRTQKNWSQGDLADALDISRQSVSKWETDASIPELDKLLKLSALFGVTLDELVRGEDEELRDQMRVYSFASMDPLLPLAKLLENEYSAKNTLWKNRMDSRYFLLINRGNSKSGFEQACFRLSEYGREEHITYATEAYYNEHFQLILKDHALRELAEI